jgi:hypothetical protein
VRHYGDRRLGSLDLAADEVADGFAMGLIEQHISDRKCRRSVERVAPRLIFCQYLRLPRLVLIVARVQVGKSLPIGVWTM